MGGVNSRVSSTGDNEYPSSISVKVEPGAQLPSRSALDAAVANNFRLFPNDKEHDTNFRMLYVFLGKEICRNYLGKLGKSSNLDFLITCWTEIVHFMKIPTFSPLRHERGLVIFLKYVLDDAMFSCINGGNGKSFNSLQISKTVPEGCLSTACESEKSALSSEDRTPWFDIQEEHCRNHFSSRLNFLCVSDNHLVGVEEASATDKSTPVYGGESTCAFANDGFDWLRRLLFRQIYYEIYAPFIQAGGEGSAARLLSSTHHKHHMKISVEDFMFDKALGEGSFGMVVLCHRISNGARYAMKVQDKDEMVAENDGSSNLCSEVVTLAKCDHPYISKIICSFQRGKLAMMVLEHAEHGDLNSYMKAQGVKFLPLDRVTFYISELVSAVAHLHRVGLVHRDIKPGNILLKANRHIALTDFGACLDATEEVARAPNVLDRGEKSETFSYKEFRNSSTVSKMISRSGKMFNSKNWRKDSSYVARANTIVGTDSYMAPEIAYLTTLPENVRSNVTSYYFYTKAADWWSVGATTHKLATGKHGVPIAAMTTILKSYEFVGGAGDYLEELEALDLRKKPAGNKSPLQSNFSGNIFSQTSSSESASIERKHRIERIVSESYRSSGHVEMLAKNESHDITTGNNIDEGGSMSARLKSPQPALVTPLLLSGVSLCLKDFVSALLDVNFVTRLGSGRYGSINVRDHKLFGEIDWKKVESCSSVAPSINLPTCSEQDEEKKSVSSNFGTLARGLSRALSSLSSKPADMDEVEKKVGSKWAAMLSKMTSKKVSTEGSTASERNQLHLQFEKLLHIVGKSDWVGAMARYPSTFSADQFMSWNYISPDFIFEECGLDV